MAGFIDTHTHLYTEEFDGDRELVLARAEEAGVTHLFMPNIDDTSVESMLALCDSHERCYPMIGLHPTAVGSDWRERLSSVRRWLDSSRRFYGIGEVGLDLYWDKTFVNEQMRAFDEQIQWAVERNLPLVVHCRDAYPELFEVMEPYRGTELKGIFHSFTGTEEDVARLLDYPNFMLGINGVVTFKKSTLPEALPHVPVERIVLETDSPYLAPVPFRGKRNESAYIVKVAEKVADIYSMPVEDVARITGENALRIFAVGE